MKKISNNLLVCFAASIFFVSCKRDISLEKLPDYDKALDFNKNWDKSVPKVAGIVSSLLKQKDFRAYLKSEVLKTFDGDYDVLLSSLLKDMTQKSFKPSSRGSQTALFADPSQIAYLQTVADEFPQMHLSVQVDPNEWDADSYTPPVVYTSSDYNESTTLKVPVVDEFGNTSRYLDAQTDPVEPVVIVTQNERTIVGPNGDVYLAQPVGPDGWEGTMGIDSLPPIDPTVPMQWYRQNFKYETIYAIGFWDIGKIEGWPAGGPELRTYHYSATDTIGTSYPKEGYYAGQTWAKRKSVKNKWYNLPDEKLVTTHLWRWGQTGTTFKYAFYEWDYEPFRKEHADSLASFITKFAKIDPSGTVTSPIQLAASAVKLIGLFLPKDGKLSESIGDLEISANNNANEFHLATGGFGWRSKPY